MDYSYASATGMLRVCEAEGCKTVVFGGGTCTEHDRRELLAVGRGRPFVEQAAAGDSVGEDAPSPMG